MLKVISLLLVIASLAGCASQSAQSGAKRQMGNLLLAEPAAASYRSQHAIARYNQILAQAPLKDNEKAELLYQRGLLYDSVGLSGLARYDFDTAIQLKPDLAEAYNSMGIHYTQQKQFVQAYEMFDSTLEINPDYDYAFLNRGIALYYGGRPDLATHDLAAFFAKDQSDPYRALWNYIAAKEIDPAAALLELSQVRQDLAPDHWANMLVDFYLGIIDERQLLMDLVKGVQSQRQLTDRLCEAYFYLGKYHRDKGDKGVASNYFKLALSTNVYEYVEHRYARLELGLLRETKLNQRTQ